MPDQVQLRGGTAADNDGFTGVNREVTVDTTNKTLRVHDGVAAGGHPLIQGTPSTLADADTIAKRDAWGRLQVADPQDAQDATSKSYVDGQIADSVVSDATRVETEETTTSTTYTDLATVQAVTDFPVPASGVVLVTVTARTRNNTADNSTHMGFALSGANTLAANDARAVHRNGNVNFELFSARFRLGSLTPGDTTFTAKFRVSGSTGRWQFREIIVEAGV
ncbi:MAG: hypothetical protein WDZ42_00975 [Candidatus Saccharimonadales bacterium]